MLDHLAACGHVERTRSETDRRVVVTRLTPGGRRRIRARREEWRSRWQQALSDLPVEDLRAATRVLERLGAMFEDVPAGNGCDTAKSSPERRPRSPLE
jgi:DNA-binding MarR family transcriptional regulator